MAVRVSQELKERHVRLKSWFWTEMRRQAANRYQMALDEDYYDSLQWRAEEANAVLKRGQFPVAWNEVAATVDWLIGTERRTRRDFQILPRNDASDEAHDDAELKTKFLKYLNDVNRADMERSQAADNAFKAGLGWIEVGVRADPEQDPVYVRSESWRWMLYDSLGERLDLEDARYVFRFKWMDVDIAKAYFPGNDAKIEKVKVNVDNEPYMRWWHGRRIEEFDDLPIVQQDAWRFYDAQAWLNNPRQRVLIVECWHKEPSSITTGRAVGSTYDRNYMRMRCTVFTDEDVLFDGWSPYAHNQFPFVPVWCYRRKRDNAPYGVIRRIRPAQDAINKSMSKAIWEVSANQLMVEKGAVDKKVMSLDQIRDEAQAPDGVLILENGAISKGAVKFVDRNGKVDAHMKIAEIGVTTVRNSSGVTAENRGLKETEDQQSARAVELRQNQGSLSTSEIFDNQRFAHQMEGDLTLSVVEQYAKESMVFGVLGERTKFEYAHANMVDPETGAIIGDLTARKAQFIVGEQAWRQSIAHAAAESLMDLLGQVGKLEPKLVGALLPAAIELMDLPNRKTTIRAVRQAFGQSNPDEKPTPEEVENTQKQKMLADAQFEAQLQGLRADIAAAQFKGQKLEAETVAKRVEAMYSAMQAAGVIATLPQITNAADTLLRSAGFHDEDAPPLVPTIPTATAASAAPALPAALPVSTHPNLPAKPGKPNGAGVGALKGIETPSIPQ